jgi:uncharacterized membrane protein YecN with MAPEG domain
MLRKSALLSTIGLIAALIGWRTIMSSFTPQAAETEAQRLGLGFASLLPAVSVLALMVLAQILGRAATPQALDPTACQESRFLLVNQRVIANTVEQMTMFAPALLAFAARAEPGQMGSITALGFVFAMARLVFWAGYLRAPLFRAPGMAATAGCTVAALVTAIWVWLV